MKYEIKQELQNLAGFCLRLKKSMSADMLEKLLDVVPSVDTFQVKFVGGDAARLSTKIGIELAQCILTVNYSRETIEIRAEEKGMSYCSERIMTVAANAYTRGRTWEDTHEQEILPLLKEVRILLADKVIADFRKSLALYPEDEVPGAEPDEE